MASISADRGGRLQSVSTADSYPTLALLTGALDPSVWQEVEPTAADYMRWHGARVRQADWGAQTHSWYWSEHLCLWPRTAHRAQGTGLAASYAARWLRDGYSQGQIARALGYAHTRNAPKSLWLRAADYRDWLDREAPTIRTNGLGAVVVLEDGYADGARRQWPDDPDAEDRARRYVRERWRTPRVVTVDEWEATKFGMPEPFSEQLISASPGLDQIGRAEEALRAEQPFHADVPAAA